jgi:adenylate cyclase
LDAIAPARLQRSFAFIDLCGFIGYLDEHGDDAALRALVELRAITRRAADDHGVRIAKWLGDGALIIGLDEQPLTASVLAILHEAKQRVALAVRAGISSGPVLQLDGDDYIGTAINIAARLCARAPAGRLLIAGSGAAAAPATRTIRVRGVSEPVAVRELDPGRSGANEPGAIRRDGNFHNGSG